jgi:four helix bundle protein
MSEELKRRTKAYALRVMRLCDAIPNTPAGRMIRGQLLRAGTSVGANYRAACRAKSPADFIAKMGIVEEEADESLFWMELLVEGDLLPKERLTDLMAEGDELVAIFVASINTARANNPKPHNRR